MIFCPYNNSVLSNNQDIFVIASDIPGASINFGKPEEKLLGKVPVGEMKRYMAEGHFPPGSMGPKVEACIRFIENNGKRAIITDIASLSDSIEGNCGTQVVS